MEILYQDCVTLLEQANLQDKELRHKRRWLIGLPTSQSESGEVTRSKFQIEKPTIPENLLREDDVSYETIKSLIENASGKRNTKNNLQDDMQLIHPPATLLSLIDNMTNQGLLQSAEILTGGTIKFEKTRWEMKQIIKKCLLEQKDARLLESYSSLLKNPQTFRWSNESRFIPDSDSYHVAVHKILNILEDLPTQTLSAMNRKLKSTKKYTPKLKPKKSGYGRETLIKRLRKKCLGYLSKLKKGDLLQEPLANVMEVAALNLKLIQGCQFVTNFKQVSSRVIVLQNEIAMCIKLIDQKLELSVLKDLIVLLDPEAKLYERKLRLLIKNLLTEYLYECADMDTVPQSLVQVLGIIKKKSDKQFAESRVEDEVECVMSVSACMKQVLWDLIPEDELDLDLGLEFADAYMEALEDSDYDDICDIENNVSDSGEAIAITGDNFMLDESLTESCDSVSFCEEKKSEHVYSMHYHLVNLKNSREDSEKNSCEERNLMVDNESVCKNQYVGVQAASDDVSMVAYGLIGRMLNDFAQMEGREINSGDLSYLGVGSCNLKQKKRKGVREEDGGSVIIKAVEELIPSFAECEADRLKEMMGCIK